MSYVLTVPVRAHTIIAAYMIILQRLGPVTSTSLHSAQQFVYCRVFRFDIIIVRKFFVSAPPTCRLHLLNTLPSPLRPPKGRPYCTTYNDTKTPYQTNLPPRQTHQQPRPPQQTSQSTQGVTRGSNARRRRPRNLFLISCRIFQNKLK